MDAREALPAKLRATQHAEPAATWLTYTQAASYTGWSIGHLRNLVSAGQIPVYGRPRYAGSAGIC